MPILVPIFITETYHEILYFTYGVILQMILTYLSSRVAQKLTIHQ